MNPKKKRNPLEKFLDQKMEFTYRHLITLIIFSLGIGALLSFISFIVGVILIVFMILILCFMILPHVITFKGAP